MAYSEDHIVLAAEYALGTLDGAERTQVQTMMAVDKDFAAVVEAWEFRLSVLNQMVGLIEPRPELWERIKAAISRTASQLLPTEVDPSQSSFSFVEAKPIVDAVSPSEQVSAVPMSATEVESGSLSAEPTASTEVATTEGTVASAEQTPFVVPTSLPMPPPLVSSPDIIERDGPQPLDNSEIATPTEIRSDTAPSNVVALTSKVRRWRALASAMTAVAAALVALLSVQVYRPELLPSVFRAKTIGANASQYVALLQSDGTSPAFILTVDAASRNFTVRRVGATSEPGKSYELWLVSDTLQKPRSLGVIGGSDFTTRPVLSSYDADTLNRATYAVTLEPEGGSPTGAATGPIVFSGKLIETVPTAPSR